MTEQLSQSFEFKPMTESDLPLFHVWLNRPHVAEWWDERTGLQDVREIYLPLLNSKSSAQCYFAQLNEAPVGFIQSYNVVAQQSSGWWLDETDPNAVGIDQFLADAENPGKGVETEMVRQFAKLLFQDPAVTKIRTDPSPTNPRAIRCYEKPDFAESGSSIHRTDRSY